MALRCRISSLAAAAALASLAPPAAAAEASFANNLASPLIVSPAQVYQVNATRVDLGVRYDSRDDIASYGATGDAAQNSHTTDATLEAVVPFSTLGLRLGLKVEHGLTVYGHLPSVVPLAETPAGSGVTSSAGALLAYTLGPVVLGVEADYTARSMTAPSGDAGVEDRFTAGRAGLLWQGTDFELGLAGQTASPARVGPVATGDQPATALLHGRYALDRSFALGAIIQDALWSRINTLLTDRQSYTVTVEHSDEGGPSHIEGSIGYRTPNAKNNAYTGPTVGAVAFSIGEDYAVLKSATAGAAFSYETGTGRTSAYKVSTNVVSVQVRGDYRF